jgi:hypothetical protein
MPVPPDPEMPGLLDLLTVGVLGSVRPPAVDAPIVVGGAGSEGRTPRDPRSRRLWVEVEV